MSSTENNRPGSPEWSYNAVEPRAVPADSIARALREARVASNQDLDDVAQFLRIRYDYLLAIEEGRFEDLPGPTYAVGFVRAYADHLKLDGDAIASRFKGEVAELSDRTELVFPAPVPESRIPGSTIVLFSILLIAGAYGVWYYFSSDLDQTVAEVATDEIAAPEATAPTSDEEAGAPVAPEPVQPVSGEPASGGNGAGEIATAGAPETPAANDTPAEDNATASAQDTSAPLTESSAAATAPAEEASEAASALEIAEVPAPPSISEQEEATTAAAEAGSEVLEDPAADAAETLLQAPGLLDNDATEAAGLIGAGEEQGSTTDEVTQADLEEAVAPPLPPAIPPRRVRLASQAEPSAVAETAVSETAVSETAVSETAIPETPEEQGSAAEGSEIGTLETEALAPQAVEVGSTEAEAVAPDSPVGEAGTTPSGADSDTSVEDAPAPGLPAVEVSEPVLPPQRPESRSVSAVPLPPPAAPQPPTPVRPANPTSETQPTAVQQSELGSAGGTTVYGSENANARVVVRAVFDSYVLIRDADEKLLLTKVLRSGDVYRVPNQSGLTMLTGNAGGLQIEVDGQQAPTIGPVGAIVRNVSLDPSRLRSGTAVGR